jgi:hypothetical protein
MKHITGIEKMEFVQNLFNQLGLDFSHVTVEQAFQIYRDITSSLEMIAAHPIEKC